MAEAVTGVPPRKTPNVPHDADEWDTIAETARKQPNKPILAGRDLEEGFVKRMRGWTRYPYRSAEGNVVVNGRNSEVQDGLRVFKEVYMTFVPARWPKTKRR